MLPQQLLVSLPSKHALDAAPSVLPLSHTRVLASFLFALNSCFPSSMPSAPAAMGVFTCEDRTTCLRRNRCWSPCTPGTPCRRPPGLAGGVAWALAPGLSCCSTDSSLLLSPGECRGLCWIGLAPACLLLTVGTRLAVPSISGTSWPPHPRAPHALYVTPTLPRVTAFPS